MRVNKNLILCNEIATFKTTKHIVQIMLLAFMDPFNQLIEISNTFIFHVVSEFKKSNLKDT